MTFFSTHFLQFHTLKLLRKRIIRTKFSLIIGVLSLVFSALTLAVLSGFSAFSARPNLLIFVLLLDVILFLTLSLLVARKVLELWSKQRKGLAGSKLQIRLTLIFSVLALLPTVIITVLSVSFFHFGVQDWFSRRVKNALNESLAVSESYLKEHKSTVAKDASLMAYEIDQKLEKMIATRKKADQYLTALSNMRSLSEAILFDQDQNLIARSNLTFALQFEPLPANALSDATQGKVSLLSSTSKDRIRALVALPRHPHIYLLVGRAVDPNVMHHFQRAQAVVTDYGILEGKRLGFELVIVGLFCIIGLFLLMLSIWIGLLVSEKLIYPIKDLIQASEKISTGNFAVRVKERKQKDELSVLTQSFNKMTSHLESQKNDLLEINKTLDERRQFIESTLSGVSCGVIGLSNDGLILYPNQVASSLLGVNLEKKKNKHISQVIPSIQEFLDPNLFKTSHLLQKQIDLSVQNVLRTFQIHVVPEKAGKEIQGFVVTLDDITDLIAAQRQAAWSDVAKQVAHEIKNPLTPISLSAERLKLKYAKEITTTPSVFLNCIDTIIRQVNFIGHLVSEFSAFARLPQMVIAPHDLVLLCQQALDIQKEVYRSITFTLETSCPQVLFDCDAQQVNQVISNLLKNAIESILESPHPLKKKEILIQIKADQKTIHLFIKDTGPGFPEDKKNNLLDPYVTTRSHGTGLGLSITKKIVENHNGTIVLDNQKKSTGALIHIGLPRTFQKG